MLYFHRIEVSEGIDFNKAHHCVKSVRIRSFSGLHFPAFGLSTDQKKSKYGHFSRSDKIIICIYFRFLCKCY